jgi:hypothetical protein
MLKIHIVLIMMYGLHNQQRRNKIGVHLLNTNLYQMKRKYMLYLTDFVISQRINSDIHMIGGTQLSNEFVFSSSLTKFEGFRDINSKDFIDPLDINKDNLPEVFRWFEKMLRIMLSKWRILITPDTGIAPVKLPHNDFRNLDSTIEDFRRHFGYLDLSSTGKIGNEATICVYVENMSKKTDQHYVWKPNESEEEQRLALVVEDICTVVINE